MTAAGQRCRGRDEGSASVLTAGAVAALLVILTGALVVVSVVRDVHRVRAAADLAALAAAGPLVAGGEVSCSVGSSVARANGATLTRCAALGDGSVEVGAEVSLPWPAGWAGLPGHATASARAGVVGGPS